MKILMLNYEFPPLGGGAANANYYMLKEISKMKGVFVDLITSSANNKFEIEQFSRNIRIFKLNVNKKNIHYWKMSEILKWTLKADMLSAKLVRKNKYDVCHCWFGWPSGILGYRLRELMPYVVALRGSDVPGYNPRLKFLDKYLFTPVSRKVWRNAAMVTTNSSGLRELALRTFTNDINVICNGVDFDDYKPNYRVGKGLRLLCVSRLIERKGLKYLIKAISQLNDVTLTLIGEGDQEKELKSMVEKFGISSKVRFLGYVPHNEIKKYYQNSDVFILPSLNEGMSNTVLEAMASGLALIMTDVGGSQELIKSNGYVIKKKSSKDIKNSLLKYQIDSSLIRKHGKQSRKISENMGWNNFTEMYLRAYRKLI